MRRLRCGDSRLNGASEACSQNDQAIIVQSQFRKCDGYPAAVRGGATCDTLTHPHARDVSLDCGLQTGTRWSIPCIARDFLLL